MDTVCRTATFALAIGLFLSGCCRGSSGSREKSVAVERVFAIVVEAFFKALGTRLPSTSRWHTFGPTLSIQAGGMLCHQIMPRALKCVDKTQAAAEA